MSHWTITDNFSSLWGGLKPLLKYLLRKFFQNVHSYSRRGKSSSFSKWKVSIWMASTWKKILWVITNKPTVHSGGVIMGRVSGCGCRHYGKVTGDTQNVTHDMGYLAPESWLFYPLLSVSVRFGIGATIRTRWEIQCPPTLTHGCIKVHGEVPIALCLFGDPL